MSTTWKQAIVNDLTKFTYLHWGVLLHATRDMTLEEYTPLTPLSTPSHHLPPSPQPPHTTPRHTPHPPLAHTPHAPHTH